MEATQEPQAPAKNSTPAQSDNQQDSNPHWKHLEARLGRRYANCKLSNYEVRSDAQRSVVDSVREYLEGLIISLDGVTARAVLLYGPVGTGKDHLLAAMMRFACNSLNMRVVWRDGSDLFGEFRDNMRGGIEESKLLERFTGADVLAISDPVPPFGGLTEYQAGMFFRIIDRRYRDMRPTWITINVKDRAEAVQRMGASIVDRLGHNALGLCCNWESYRKP